MRRCQCHLWVRTPGFETTQLRRSGQGGGSLKMKKEGRRFHNNWESAQGALRWIKTIIKQERFTSLSGTHTHISPKLHKTKIKLGQQRIEKQKRKQQSSIQKRTTAKTSKRVPSSCRFRNLWNLGRQKQKGTLRCCSSEAYSHKICDTEPFSSFSVLVLRATVYAWQLNTFKDVNAFLLSRCAE